MYTYYLSSYVRDGRWIYFFLAGHARQKFQALYYACISPLAEFFPRSNHPPEQDSQELRVIIVLAKEESERAEAKEFT